MTPTRVRCDTAPDRPRLVCSVPQASPRQGGTTYRDARLSKVASRNAMQFYALRCTALCSAAAKKCIALQRATMKCVVTRFDDTMSCYWMCRVVSCRIWSLGLDVPTGCLRNGAALLHRTAERRGRERGRELQSTLTRAEPARDRGAHLAHQPPRLRRRECAADGPPPGSQGTGGTGTWSTTFQRVRIDMRT